jgi:putative glutamine amidotransferase
MTTPTIGITVGTSVSWRRNGYNFRSYSAPVEAAGAKCVPMGVYAGRDLSKCAGLVVTGGWDIHPDTYDRLPGDENLTAHEVMGRYRVGCEAKRDDFEFDLLRAAIEAGMPILGICRGIQAVNVVLARKLIPDIPTCVPNALRHMSPGFGTSLSHEIRIEPDSIIERAYGAREITVNTRHHQGMTPDMVADVLRVTAIAPDGVVEAIEGTGDAFLVGVQWHPERKKDAFIHDISGPLFEAFVDACRRRTT